MKNPVARPGQSASALASLEAAQQFFADRGDQPWVQPRGFSLICKRATYTESVDVLWDAPNHLVWILVGLDATPPPAHRADLAAAICVVNAELPVNGFQLRRGVAWKSHVFLDERGAVAAEVLGRAVDLAAVIVFKYRPYLVAAATGKPLPALPAHQETLDG